MDRVDITTAIFTVNPCVRFSETMRVDREIWEDMWYKHDTLRYSKLDLKEWFELKTRRTISIKTIGRWIDRQEMYNAARMAVKSGVREVSMEYFNANSKIPYVDIVDNEEYYT